jgi:hypothetical protein
VTRPQLQRPGPGLRSVVKSGRAVQADDDALAPLMTGPLGALDRFVANVIVSPTTSN